MGYPTRTFLLYHPELIILARTGGLYPCHCPACCHFSHEQRSISSVIAAGAGDKKLTKGTKAGYDHKRTSALGGVILICGTSAFTVLETRVL